MSDQPQSAPTDYDRLMHANLSRVFGEPDAARRIVAIRELYAEDAVLYEADDVAKGHIAINEAVTALLARLPANFVFSATGPAAGHHDVGRLKWQAGPNDGPAAATGMDVAHVKGGVIHSLHVFLDSSAT